MTVPATRDGEPAWKNAPPRLRASDFTEPFVPYAERTTPTLFERLRARMMEN